MRKCEEDAQQVRQAQLARLIRIGCQSNFARDNQSIDDSLPYRQQPSIGRRGAHLDQPGRQHVAAAGDTLWIGKH